MSLDELKLQVECAIRHLMSALQNRENEALDFVLKILRRCVLEDHEEQELTRALQDVERDKQTPSPIQSDFRCSSPPPSPEQKKPPRNKKKLSTKTATLRGLSMSYSQLLGEVRKQKKSRKGSCVRCTVCSDWTGQRAELLRHVAAHDGAPAACRRCRYTFSNLAQLVLHKELDQCAATSRPHKKPFVFRHTELIEKFNFTTFAVCPFCALRFSRASNLRAHMRRGVCARPPPCEEPRKCTYCLQEYESREALSEHLQKVHSHKCTMCEEVFPTVPLMKAHRHSTCALNKQQFHKCTLCGKSFPNRRELRLHLKELHQDGHKDKDRKRFACGACGWRTSRAYNLRRHEAARGHGTAAAAPDGRAPPQLACDRCPALLRSVASLNSHLIAHAEECPFVCAHCGKGFHYKNTLRRHVSRHLAADAPHACPRCPRTFARRDHLVRHQREVHDMRRKLRVRTSKTQKVAAAAGAGASAGQEPQFLSLLDVQSGEMFTVPSHLAYSLLCEERRQEWGAGPGVATLLPAADNIVLLTNVPALLQSSPA